jgi:threonine synthase
VPSAIGDFLILSAIRDTGGTAVAVTDEALLAEQSACATTEGVLMCPEGAATLAAVTQLRESGWLTGKEEVVALNTGTNLKYPHTATFAHPPHLPKNATLPL